MIKKALFILFGVAGVGLAIYSIMNGWLSWTQGNQFGMSIPTDPIPGYKHWQGIAVGVSALLAAALLYFKPKFSILPGLAISAFALHFKMTPPVPESGTYEPLFAVTLAVIAGAVIALAGLIAPKKK